MHESSGFDPYGKNFAGFTEVNDDINRFGCQFIPGPEDEVYIDALRRMHASQDAAVFEGAELLGYLTPPDRPESERAYLAEEYALFLSDDGEPSISQEIQNFLDTLADAPEDAYIGLLEEMNDSEFCSQHEWMQRLVTVLLFSHQSELRRQHNNTIMTNGKNFFNALKAFVDHKISR